MLYTSLTKKALTLCFEAHKDQVDKTGLPYVFHPFHLAEQMDDELSTVCALLHDVVEDTDITFGDLLHISAGLFINFQILRFNKKTIILFVKAS